MSEIRVSHGSATVELESDDFAYHDGTVSTRYRADDLIKAAVQALKAADTAEADDWLRAIEYGAERQGRDL